MYGFFFFKSYWKVLSFKIRQRGQISNFHVKRGKYAQSHKRLQDLQTRCFWGWNEMSEGVYAPLEHILLKMDSCHSVPANCISMQECEASVENLLTFQSDNYAKTFYFKY